MAVLRISFPLHLLLILSNMERLMGNFQTQLIVGYYDPTCKFAELVVQNEVRRAVSKNIGFAAGLLRLHFHDCFVRGCDGSVLIDSTPRNKAEKGSSANGNTLRGMKLVDGIKTRLERLCPGVVSCADILAFAARDSIAATGGISYLVPAGRKDGRTSLASEASTELPSPSSNLAQITELFSRKGFSQNEMVALLGAHTIGRSHCHSFASRLYNFSAAAAKGRRLDASYAAELKQQCPKSGNKDRVVPMDPISPNFMDSGYYINVLTNKGLFVSDETLVSEPLASLQVLRYAKDPLGWNLDFSLAMVKMGHIGVLTGDKGEVRSNCRVIN